MPSKFRALPLSVFWMAAVCLDVGLALAQQPPQPTEERRVVAVRIVTEDGAVIDENPADLVLQPGQPFSSDVVRESLRHIYRVGRYADVRAETTAVADGVRLDFVVQQNFYINLVRVIGLKEPPGEPLAISSMRLGLGEAFRESALKEAMDRLRQTLQEEGLYEAQLTHELVPHPETRQMDIIVGVTPGPRARIREIQLTNHTELADAKLLSKSKLKPGREITSLRLQTASERLRKYLAGKGHLSGRVGIRRGDYDPQTNTLPLTMEVIAGPSVRVELEGAKIPESELRRMLPIYEEGAVDEDLLQEGRRNLRDYLERDGYFDATARYSMTEHPVRTDVHGHEQRDLVVTYQIDRGPRRRLLGNGFEGNKYFSGELLASRLRLQPAAFLSRGRFSGRLLDEDVASIRALYVANGFRNADVRGEVVEDYRGREGDLFVRFLVNEGSQTRVANLRLEGNQTLSNDELLAVIGSTEGQPYSEFNISGDRDNVLALYYNEGFPEARFNATVEEVPEKNESAGNGVGQAKSVQLIYLITEGPQIKVERVLLDGYEHTRRGVIDREVRVKPGEPLRQGDVIETQRRLYNLGMFTRVSIAPQNPTGTDPTKTVVVLLEEAMRYTVAYGGGVEVQRLGGTATDPVGGELRASPRGILEVTKANLTGRADTLSLKIRASTLQGRALLSYTQPNFFSHPDFSVQLTGFADKTRDIRTFNSTRYEGSLQLTQRVSLVTSLLYRYFFRRVTVGSLRISPAEIPLFNQPTRISGFGATWLRERRDSPTDATRGDFNTVDLSIAGRPLGSSASFVRFFVQNSTFHPVGRHLVFARSVRFGLQEPIGSTLSTDIPLPERFFAGGGNSLRGFGLNQAGPRDPVTGFPVGGLAMLVFNQELRFPMRLPWVGSRLGGTLFYDAGNVFERANHITLRPSPPSPTDLNYFSHTIGFGFRYQTPIGPVRVDLAYQLNAPTIEFCSESAAPTSSCPPGQGIQRTRLPRFQFFVNIGSIF